MASRPDPSPCRSNAAHPTAVQAATGTSLPVQPPPDTALRVQIAFAASRDTHPGKWLRGATPDDAMARIGLAYSICRHAQQAAAQRAMEAAGHASADPDGSRTVRRLRSEWLREHACNLMLAWPARLGQRQEPSLVRAIMQAGDDPTAIQTTLSEVLQHTALGMSPATFLALDARGLEHWCDNAPTPSAARFRAWRHGPACSSELPMLPKLQDWTAGSAAMLAECMRNDHGFCMQPHWHGQAVETGVWPRRHGHPLLRAWVQISGNDAAARMLGRLVELAEAATGALQEPALRTWTLGADTGMAAVETARGPLLHRVQLRDGHVEDYRVLAPTEWNFHAHGVLAQVAGCVERRLADTAVQDWALALDPCATCSVEVGDA